MTIDIQAEIVGISTIPRYRYPKRPSKYDFLDKLFKDLRPGQAVRLVVPKSQNKSSMITYWGRLAKEKGKRQHSRTVKSANPSAELYIIYLWFVEKGGA